MLADLIARVKQDHFPQPPATPKQISEFERRVRWTMDRELREFYLACNGARLFRRRGSEYSILPLERVARARVLIHDDDTEECGPASYYAICDVQDGNYVSIDMDAPRKGLYPLFDCFHETFPDPAYTKEIAASFAEFLSKSLDSNGRLYWLKRRK